MFKMQATAYGKNQEMFITILDFQIKVSILRGHNRSTVHLKKLFLTHLKALYFYDKMNFHSVVIKIILYIYNHIK